ncbi:MULTISPECIES: hypothetical protein [unclassified Myroides]|uniref:hypothetical protein n=1 Tax=unclassified Myroides TaxID=2642485 RepID=UPI003D2F64D8
MKKVTHDQIAEITAKLNQRYELKFDTFRDEVVDHMACEIEAYLEQGVDYATASKRVLAKWHFDLKPVLGEKGIPTCIVKQLYRKDAISYTVFAFTFLFAWILGSYDWVIFVPHPWISLACIVVGFSISVGVQKRFYKQANYEMKFYIHALGALMLVNIIGMTLAMLLIRNNIESFLGLSAYSFFVFALHVLLLNVFFASKVIQHHKTQTVQLK